MTALATRHNMSPRTPAEPVPVPPAPVPTPVVPIAPVIPPGVEPPGPPELLDVLAAELARQQREAIDRLATLLTELQARISAVEDRLERLLVPQAVPDGYVALRKAAELLGRSDEYLRQRAARGEIEGEVISGRWFVNISALARLALPKNSERGRIES
jgi:hypothetical protein